MLYRLEEQSDQGLHQGSGNIENWIGPADDVIT